MELLVGTVAERVHEDVPRPLASGSSVADVCTLAVRPRSQRRGRRPGRRIVCGTQSHALRLDGYSWTYRAGSELIAPDDGKAALDVVCRLRRPSLVATVYDSGQHQIGTRVCGWYVAGAWRRS